MLYIEKNDWTPSSLLMSTMELAAMVDTYPAQICRWKDDGLFKMIDGKYYEPMASIVALLNWRGRGRIPKPVLKWRELLGAKPNRRAFLDGMSHAFDLVSQIANRTGEYNPKFYSMSNKGDPAYEAAEVKAEEGTDDGELTPADMDALKDMSAKVDAEVDAVMKDYMAGPATHE